jgi:hypothetical protein
MLVPDMTPSWWLLSPASTQQADCFQEDEVGWMVLL